MSFIQSAFLVGLATVAIPIALHFLTRWQVEQVDLGTSRFLREIVHDGAKRRIIRRWLLLFSRIAAVALLALLFARPYLSQTSYDDNDRLHLILIDRSASMGMRGDGGRLVDHAVSAALGTANAFGPNARCLLAWFDEDVTPIKEKVTNLSPPSALHGDTNYANALSWARDQMASHSDKQCDIVLITDLQQSGLGKAAIEDSKIAFPKGTQIRIFDVGRTAANNLSIVSASAPMQRVMAGSQVSVKASLFNYSPVGYEEIPLMASLTNGSQNLQIKKSVSVSSGQGNDFDFDVGKLAKGQWEISIRADVDDDLAFDNSRFTAIEIADSIPTLVVDVQPNSAQSRSAGFYLAAALESMSTMSPKQSDSPDPKERTSEFAVHVITDLSELPSNADAQVYPLCIVAAATSMDVRSIDLLSDYVNGGSKLLVFANANEGSNTDPLSALNNSQLVPGQLQQVRHAGATPFRITSVDEKSTMLGLFADPQEGDLSRIAFHKVQTCDLADRTRVLARFDQGLPAIVEHKIGQGRIIWFMSSADSSMSNWTKSPLYVPLVQQMTADLLDLTGEGPIRQREVGHFADLANDTDEASMRQVAYQGGKSGLSSDPGIKKSEGVVYVFNSVAKESDTSRVTVEEFARQFDLTLTENNEDQTTKSSTETRDEYWHWLAAILLVVVIGEYALSNRTSA